jgi:hypothetical protein
VGTVTGKKTSPGGKTVFTITIQDNGKDACVRHIRDACKKHGTTYHTGGNSKKNRRASLRGKKGKKGFDRDEWPMAMFKEGGAGASVRNINPSQNRSMGSRIGALCRGLPRGTEVRIRFVP